MTDITIRDSLEPKKSLGALLGETIAATRDHYEASAIYNSVTAPRAAKALLDLTNYIRELEQRAQFMEGQYRKLQGWLTEFSTENATAVNAASGAGWRAIETAPKDDTIFLTYGEGRTFIAKGSILWRARTPTTPSHLSMAYVTHWMPLPCAPAQAGEG